MPPAPYDACEKKAGRVSSQLLVRYRGTDYSVPTAFGHREVLIRGYVHEVVISCGAEVIARHPRSYEREDFVFNPLHYLPLLEHKIGALDQAAPLVGWNLPEEFATLRRLIEARMAKRGKREFVQILRLLEAFRAEDVLAGVRETIAQARRRAAPPSPIPRIIHTGIDPTAERKFDWSVCSGPAGVMLANWLTASVMRRHIV